MVVFLATLDEKKADNDENMPHRGTSGLVNRNLRGHVENNNCTDTIYRGVRSQFIYVHMRPTTHSVLVGPQGEINKWIATYIAFHISDSFL